MNKLFRVTTNILLHKFRFKEIYTKASLISVSSQVYFFNLQQATVSGFALAHYLKYHFK